MSTRRGRYYIGRVIKLGLLDQEKLMDAIVSAPVMPVGKFTWAITGVIDNRNDGLPFVFGRLSKFSPEGHVKIVDKDKKSEIDAIAPNLLMASSPFVYLPKYSGIAYLPVWNGIQDSLFKNRFKQLIEHMYDNFFVDCSIEPIADYRAFTAKLKSLDSFTKIEANVNPPNPLFGRLWTSLFEYIKERNASEVKIAEESISSGGLKTQIVEHIEGILNNPKYEPQGKVAIADAALLMAADGYGHGKVTGISDGEDVLIRTTDSQKSFLATKEPNPSDLAIAANNILSKVSNERDMHHP